MNKKNEKEIVITRIFNAPRELVFSAMTESEHIENWLGPRSFNARVEANELEAGGRWCYVMIDGDGKEYPSEGRFVEFDPPYRYVTSDQFGEGHPGEIETDLKGLIVTATFEDLGSRTKLTMVLSHPTVEMKRQHEEMGLMAGWESSFGCLDDLLAELGVSASDVAPNFSITAQGSNEIVVLRTFAAGPQALFDAHTRAELAEKWMQIPGMPMQTCEVDCRIGGRFRYVWRGEDGVDMGVTGTFVELDEPCKIVHTEIFDEDWSGGETTVTTTFEPLAEGDATVVKVIHRYGSEAARDAVLQSPMGEGMEATYTLLEQALAVKA